MNITDVVVIGAGAMGSGIAYVIASSGYNVTIVDREEEYLKSGMGKIQQKLKEGIERKKMTPAEAQKIHQKLKTSTNLEEVAAKAQLVIEAVFENMDVKKEIFGTLSKASSADAILASNTSTLSVTEIASVVDQPERVVGMHFFNPPEAMKLVEIIIGEQTSEETKQTAIDFASAIGKTPIPAKDSPGFIVNRLLVPMLNEAIKLLDEGVATIDEIDQQAVEEANFPAGPFVLADMVGLDVALASMRTLERELGDAYAPSPSLVKLVEAGNLGMKSGAGFHSYGDKKEGTDVGNEATSDVLANLSMDKPEFIIKRLQVPMVNEAAKLLDEDVASPADIDQAAVLGANFPEGPFVLADKMGLDEALSFLQALEKELGKGYKPSPTLVELVEQGHLGEKSGKGFHSYN